MKHEVNYISNAVKRQGKNDFPSLKDAYLLLLHLFAPVRCFAFQLVGFSSFCRIGLFSAFQRLPLTGSLSLNSQKRYKANLVNNIGFYLFLILWNRPTFNFLFTIFI